MVLYDYTKNFYEICFLIMLKFQFQYLLFKKGVNMRGIITKFIQDNKIVVLIAALLIFSIFNKKKNITLLKGDKKSFFYFSMSNNSENI